MKIYVALPSDRIQYGDEFLSGAGLAELARTAERVGFTAVYDTDHPVPTGRWLDAGGHHAQDPFVTLSYAAAATQTLRLQTSIIVLPYRNPFIVARAVATLDYLSGGRVTLGVGAGYLKGEYKALGVDFERRNDLTDEYLKAMKAAWTADEFTFQGSGYQALGNRILPRPIQRPHPPIIIGGNSKRAIRRAVELADGWNPFLASASVSATTRTAAIADEMGLADGIAYMRAHCEKTGRAEPPAVELGAVNELGETWNSEALLEKIGKMRELGISAVGAVIDGRTRAEWCDNAERFGVEIISKLGPPLPGGAR
jgi:probable F420-dependent oxidoreductase